MLFISEDRPRVIVRSEEDEFSRASGEKIGRKQRLYAQFNRGGAPFWAVEVANKTFSFDKMPQGESREAWLAQYDSEADQLQRGWSDEERHLIEQKLLETQGVHVLVEPPRLATPWPSYDKLTVQGKRTFRHVADENIETALKTGVELEYLIAYERQHRNDDRIIAAYEAAQVPVEESTEELVEA